MGNKQTELNNSGNQVETVPVWVKPYLTIDEATAYTGIGRDKLYEMTRQIKSSASYRRITESRWYIPFQLDGRQPQKALCVCQDT